MDIDETTPLLEDRDKTELWGIDDVFMAEPTNWWKYIANLLKLSYVFYLHLLMNAIAKKYCNDSNVLEHYHLFHVREVSSMRNSLRWAPQGSLSFFLNSLTLHGMRILFYFFEIPATWLVDSKVSKYSDSSH